MEEFRVIEPKPKRLFGVAPNVFFLGLVSFFNDVSNEMVKAVMPVFLTTVLGASPAFVGFLDGISDAVASVLRMVSGWFSDRIGKRKRLAVLGYGISLLTRGALVVVSGVWQVLTLRVVDRVGKGVREAPRDALISASVEDHEASRSFGFQRALDAFGGVVGPLMALIALPLVHINYRSFFMLASVMGLLAIFAFVFVRDRVTAPGLRPQNPIHTVFNFHHFDRGFKLFVIAVFIFGLGFMPIALVVLKAQAINCCDESVPWLYLISAIASWLCAVPAGRVAERIGRRKVITIGFLFGIIGYCVLALADTLTLMSIGVAIIGACAGLTDGMQRAFASKLLAGHNLGTGHGLLQAAIGVSSLVAGTVGGLIWTAYGATTALLIGAVMMALGTMMFVLVNHDRVL